MSRSRKGYDVDTGTVLALIVALALLAAITFLLTGPYLGTLAQVVGAAMAKSDGLRVATTVSSLEGVGTAERTITLDNKYDSIEVSGNTLTVDRKNGGEKTWKLPPEFSYSTAGDIKGAKICIQKKGTNYVFYGKSCASPGCTPGSCSFIPKEGGSNVPVRGYRCRNNAYTSNGFFQHYYSSDAPGCGANTVGNTFVRINRFVCPSSVEAGTEIGCTLVATWKCSSGEAVFSLTASREGKTWRDSTRASCNGDIRHRRFYLAFKPQPKFLGGGNVQARGKASLTDGGSQSETWTVGVHGG
ncbi:MAG: hypothetical protein SVQ76_01225 [Candidatus Nanohaloarchaea archaeon]|nr:hypothetical protein [Candidatus Nanohaloarchaea archaeon]